MDDSHPKREEPLNQIMPPLLGEVCPKLATLP